MATSALVEAIGWWPAVILLVLLLVFTFYLLAVVCDEALAPTLEELSDSWKIPHDVACATFLAAGSSAPEIFISLVSVVHGKKNSLDISLGALMGSALIAYTVIPAACILVSPGRELKLDLVPLTRDVSFFVIGLISVLLAANDGQVDTLESAWLVLLFFFYLLAMKVLSPYYKHSEDEHHFLTSEPHLPSLVDEMSSDHHHGHSHNGSGSHGHSHDGDHGHSHQENNKYGTIDVEHQNSRNPVEQESDDEPEYSVFGYVVRKVVPPFHLDERGVKDKYFWVLLISIFYISILSEIALYFAETLSDVIGVSHHLTGLVLVALGAQGKSCSRIMCRSDQVLTRRIQFLILWQVWRWPSMGKDPVQSPMRSGAKS